MLGTLIVSPLASRIRDDDVRHRITGAATAAMLDRGASHVEVMEAGEPEAIGRISAEAVAAGSGLVVIAGGDGTVRDAAGPLAGSGIPVGIVPCGTGNLYATAAGVPRDLDHAIAAIRAGTVAPHDVGEVRLVPPAGVAGAEPGAAAGPRTMPFVVACGTGFDARLIEATSREAKRRYGVAAYFLAASRLIGHLEPVPTVLIVDGVRRELESMVVLIANCGEAIPGRLRPRLPIDPDDGLLHVFVLPQGGIIGGIRGAIELMTADATGVSASGAGMRLLGTDVRVEVDPAGPTQVDGDVFGRYALEARILPGRLDVIRDGLWGLCGIGQHNHAREATIAPMSVTTAPVNPDAPKPRRRLPFTLYVLASLMLLKSLLLFLVVAGASLADTVRPVLGFSNTTVFLDMIRDTPGAGAVLVSAAVLLLLSVIGIISRRRIGWLLAMVITGLFVALDIYGFTTASANHLWMGLNILTVFYLNQQDVREAVGAAQTFTADTLGASA